MNGAVLLQNMSPASGDWAAAVREYVAWYGDRAAGILAAQEGTSRRSAERWISKATGKTSQSYTPKAARQVSLVMAAKQHRIARRLRSARRVNAHRVTVREKSPNKITARTVPILIVGPNLSQDLDAVADLVEQGRWVDAGEALGDAILAAYGVPDDTLEIVDFQQGLDFL